MAAKNSEKPQIRLPPLMLESQPKALHDMKAVGDFSEVFQLFLTFFCLFFQAELQNFILQMLKAVFDLPLTAKQFVFKSYPRPLWWPQELRWDRHYADDIPKDQVKIKFFLPKF